MNDNGIPGIDVPNYGAEAVMESEANKRQHGGDHYKKMSYEHWDFATDTNQPYLIGCATKYASRWRRKNGTEDLEKCIHYLDKAQERGVAMPAHPAGHVKQFCDQLEWNDAIVVRHIVANNFDAARSAARWLIENDGDDGA